MKKFTMLAVALAGVTAAGCKDSTAVLPLDNARIEQVTGQPLIRSTLQFLGTGVLAQDRAGVVGTPTYLVLASIYGRDVYRVDTSEPRYVSETLGNNADPGSFAGGGGYAGFYTAIRAANTILQILPGSVEGEFSDAEKAATRGFMKTIKALEYIRLIELRDTVGIAIQADNDTTLTPVSCKTPVLAYIVALLDSANTDFTAAGGGTRVPFALPTGFTAFGRDYSLVSNLVRFNRGLRGKANVYRAIDRKSKQTARATDAIADLTQALGAGAGAVPGSQFQTGIWYKFVASGSEATPNNRSDSRIGLNPMVRDSVLATDTRKSKIISRSTLNGTTQGLLFTTNVTCLGCTATSANQEAPLSLLRDEELVLLRAQAYIEAGNLTSATADLNSVHTFYGNPAWPVFGSKDAAISAVLYDKRYSFLVEGPHRLVDLREYGRLNNTYLRKETATDPFNAAFPLPRAELNARGVSTNPACTN